MNLVRLNADCRVLTAAQNPATNSSINILETAWHFPQTSNVSFSLELSTATRKLSQAAQAVVGSLESGSGTSTETAGSKRPVFSVLISNVLRQSAQT